jgi:hypothetical protein
MMKVKVLSISIILCSAMILTLPGVTKATTLGTADVQHVGYGAFEYITVMANSQYNTAHAGAYSLWTTNGTAYDNTWPSGQLTGFCIELAQPHSYDNWQYNVITPEDGPLPGSSMGLTKAKYIEELWGRYYDSSWETGSNPHQAANFSVAIWEIINEGIPASPTDWDVTSGNFIAEGDFSQANEWLYSLDGSGPKADLRVFSNGTYQDYIVAVPEPATLALLGIGALSGFLKRRKHGMNIE